MIHTRKINNIPKLRKFAYIAYPAVIVYTIIFMASPKTDYIFYSRLPTRNRLLSSQQSINKDGSGHYSQKWNYSEFYQNGRMFRNVTGDGLAMVISAYFDDTKNKDQIRAIGIKKRSYGINIMCVIWYKTRGNKTKETVHYHLVNGYITEHPEIFERSWSQVHYMCPLNKMAKHPPFAVSIMTRDMDTPMNIVDIQYTADVVLRNYTVCLHNAFNFRMDVSTEIVEWIEVNRLLGAEHFIIYNYSSHANNDAVLNWYKQNGVITVLQWDVPLYADLIFLGQVAVMTDCLYRNFYNSLLISHLDLDEFIVPRRPGLTTIPELVASLPRRCAYIARNNVFSLSYGQSDDNFEGKEIAEKYQLNTLLIRNKQNFIWKSTARSKLILRAACIEAAGVHLVNSYTTITSEMTFDPADALLQHYRKGKPKFVNKGERVRDDYMLKYSKRLTNNVDNVWRHIKSFTVSMH